MNRRKLSMVSMCAVLAVTGATALTGCNKDSGAAGVADDGKAIYKIGFQGPLTGESSAIGVNMENGVKLAVKQANARGDLAFHVEYAASDDAGSPDQSPAAAQKLIDDEGVLGLVGPAFSGAAKASGRLYSEAGLVSVSHASNPSLPELGFRSFVRSVPNDNAQGGAMVTYFTKRLGAKKVYVVDDKSEYGVGLSKVAEKQLKEAGVEVVKASVPSKTPDYTAAATAVKHSGADALIYNGLYSDAAPFAKKLKDIGFDKPKIASDGTYDKKFTELAGDAAEGWLLTCQCLDANVDPGTKQFAEDYKAEYKAPPGLYAAESYDAANLIIEQIRALGGGDGGDVRREAVLEKVKKADYKGLTRQFSFKENGEFAGNGIYLSEVKGGRITLKGNVDTLVSAG
ncbi:branched-chain amino acid ABC transporter substrate-binding protein [Streptomyces sp. NPDC051704]|uniref:branched-chain amino acid ABC transporter substrate-binding protein n=1 Tax=Streptomyces sp. NPDC051704 TaxID=3365671 RepID=UPI00379EDF1A